MRTSARRRPALGGKVAALGATFFTLLAVTPPVLTGQDPPSTAEAGLVRVDSVAVEGNQRVASETILGILGIQPGSPTSYREIQQAEKALWVTGQFNDIVVRAVGERTPGSERVIVTFHLEERPLVRQVSILGLEHASESEVRDSANLVPGNTLLAAGGRACATVHSLEAGQ